MQLSVRTLTKRRTLGKVSQMGQTPNPTELERGYKRSSSIQGYGQDWSYNHALDSCVLGLSYAGAEATLSFRSAEAGGVERD